MGIQLGNGGRKHWLLLLLLGLAFFAGLMTSLFLNIQSCKEVFRDRSAEVEDPVLLLKSQAEPDLKSLPSDLFTFHYTCSEAAPLAEVRSMLLNEIFDGVSPFEGFPPPHVAPFLRKQRIKGWGSKDKVFDDLLKEVRPQLIVELGTFLGASAIHMANISQSMKLQTLILCIDDFRGWPGFRHTFKDIHQEHGQAMLYHQFLQNVIATNLTHTILPVPFSTTSAIAKLCDLGIQADMIEVDAAHDFHSAWADINWAWALLRPGVGIMFGHDYYLRADNRGVGRAVHLFARLKGLHVQPHGSHWILRRPSLSAARSSVVSDPNHVRSGKRNRRWQETSFKYP
ncbi:hypothetical protein O6H91_08G066100 [Diphasiastrum complanatum]|uniref:Uncharacterized protein n=2 Tax=Diphasiastrum complanatum TaxID=34168 RepID=A0ACC2CZF2_DIPCM|nr:hypothetical protein O6H91_08G066100 [Diphasiastrum complanatum]KAJ7547038.1 hypothetical protein O6H91_08G066100 [Diphasiastrum complanatum]